MLMKQLSIFMIILHIGSTAVLMEDWSKSIENSTQINMKYNDLSNNVCQNRLRANMIKIGTNKSQILNKTQQLRMNKNMKIQQILKISNIQILLQNLQKQRKELQLNSLNQQLQQLHNYKQLIQTQDNSIDTKMSRNKDILRDYDIKLVNNDKLLTTKQQQISNKQIQLQLLLLAIRNKQKQLNILKNKQDIIRQQINMLDTQSKQIQQYNLNIHKNITQINVQNQLIVKVSDQITIKKYQIQLQIKNIQTKLNQSKIQSQSILNQIAIAYATKNRLQSNKNKYQSSINRLNQQLQSLKLSVNTQYKQYFNLFTSCYFPYNIKHHKSVLIPSQQFIPYLSTVYSQQIGLPEITNNKYYNLTILDPFSKQWQNKYGTAFYASDLMPYSLYLRSDISCQQNSLNREKQVGKGIIKQIKGNKVIIDNDSKILLIGACSRIQQIYSQKNINRLVYYQGYKLNMNLINIIKLILI